MFYNPFLLEALCMGRRLNWVDMEAMQTANRSHESYGDTRMVSRWVNTRNTFFIANSGHNISNYIYNFK